jgi:hypothetical protein
MYSRYPATKRNEAAPRRAPPHFNERVCCGSGLTEDAGHLGAAHRANALREAATIGLLNVTGELALLLALDAVRLACVTLSHGALLICAQTARRRCGGWRHLVPRGDAPTVRARPPWKAT